MLVISIVVQYSAARYSLQDLVYSSSRLQLFVKHNTDDDDNDTIPRIRK